MRCAVCGAEVKAGLTMCPECGTQVRRVSLLDRKLRCRSCQRLVSSGLRICPYCGVVLRRGWQRPFKILLTLAVLASLSYAAMNYVPWALIWALPERVKLPTIAFLATPPFTPTPTFTRTRTPTVTPTATPTATGVQPTETRVVPSPTATRR